MICPPRRELERAIADLPAVDRTGLLHVLTCRACRTIARKRLEEEEDNRRPRFRRADGTEPRYDRAFAPLSSGLAVERATEEVAGQLAELLALPSAERWRRVEAGEVPASAHLAEGLMAKAEHGVDDPGEIVDHSSLALRLAQQLADGGDRLPIESFRARYWIVQARVDRLLGAPDHALEILALAAGCLPDSIAAPERTAYCYEAALCYEQLGRYDEALALYDRAVELLRPFEQSLQIAHLLLLAGRLAAAGGDPHLARRRLVEAEQRFAGEADPQAAAALWLGLAAAYDGLAEPLRTHWALERARRKIAAVEVPRHRLALLAELGRSLAAVGRFDEALARLVEVRKAVADGPPWEALLANLDEVGAMLAAGLPLAPPERLAEMKTAIGRLDLHADLRAALDIGIAELAAGDATDARVRSLARYLRRARWNPLVPFRPEAG
ncbi:MAG TPA: tetratricopeptide repeat protein [Thermoanaerobaculia bacterium]|jgi:tetratricopeptide (TPR) repeat protein|nr:tetratricopeptide repeat protein [Thermoanaerobaculia bacterium]